MRLVLSSLCFCVSVAALLADAVGMGQAIAESSDGGELYYSLDITVWPDGAGRVEVDPPPHASPNLYRTGTHIRLTAVPARDCGFHHWDGDIWQPPEELDPAEIGTYATLPAVAIAIGRDSNVFATFAEYPGSSALDLVTDLTVFIRHANLPATIETLDMNKAEYWPEFSLVGNGIPDAAELFLLETILRNPGLGVEGGAWQPAIWHGWEENVAQAEKDLASIRDKSARGPIARVVAALMTLGDAGSTAMAEHLAEASLNVAVDATDYNMASWSKLSWKGDADADGVTNLQEWEHVAADPSFRTFAEKIEAYAEAALDPNIPNPRE